MPRGPVGYVPGDRLALCLPTSAALLHAIGGALRSGVVPVVVNHALLPLERDVIRQDADAREWVDDALRLDGLGSGPMAELAPFPLARPMHYTSGTTGRPKGVWSGVLGEADAERGWSCEEVEQWQLEAADVHLVCSPLQHSAPIRFALNTLLAGGTVVLPGPVQRRSWCHAVTDARGHDGVLHARPPATSRRHRIPRRPGRRCGWWRTPARPAPSCLSAGRSRRSASTRLWEFYGSTEGQFTVCASGDWLERPGTVGRARAGRSLAVDGDGAVWCRTPSWGRWEYWRDPEPHRRGIAQRRLHGRRSRPRTRRRRLPLPVRATPAT